MRGDGDRERPTAGPLRGGSGSAAVAYYRDTCGKCGARRIDRQIGLEATPDEYIATMVEVFREVRRVLRDDGTCWVNMGDSYANNGNMNPTMHKSTLGKKPGEKGCHMPQPWKAIPEGIKPKDLLMMPARLALALQADGWWLRSQIVWAKPNPMPESVTDRPTSAYEMVYLLSKRPRYFYDSDGVREPHSPETHARGTDGSMVQDRARWGNVHTPGSSPKSGLMTDNPAGRNARNVWTIATAPYSEAHFATFPPELAERCIRAGTSEKGCCAQCGTPWVRVVETHYTPGGPKHSGNAKALRYIRDGERDDSGYKTRHDTTTGWQPGCTHGADVVPATVLDPFAGAGTTLLVADRLQRNAIGIELNAAYTEMAMERCRRDAPLFADLHPPPAEDPEDERIRDLFAAAAD